MSEDKQLSDIQSLKATLRRQVLARRALVAGQDVNASLALRDHFLKKIPLPPDALVSSYIAYGSEMDPAPLTQALYDAGHAIALPVVDGKDRPLLFRAYKPEDVLEANTLYIKEPSKEAPLAEPDVLLVPLVAFDRCGRRLGAGGGYYDRTIKMLRVKKPILTIGIAYACQEVDIVPVGPFDMPIDRIATEIQVFGNLCHSSG